MLHSRPHIEAGDLVIMYFTRESMQPITVTPGEYFHNKFGRYAHADMVGMKFGSKMHAPKPHSGYIYLLRPTPELWTLSLPHRTQILYQTDISYIIQRLGVRPGTSVVEAGTGSGSMTHSLSRAVGPRGKVFSFEYHQNRFEAAKVEFEAHNLANVRINHRNVCKDGFGEAQNVQAIFLDLPAPWEAISDAIKAFDPTKIARICCFSPCLEQVLKTVTTLREQQFEDISTVEVLTRTHELVPPAPANTPARLRDVTSIVTGLKEHEDRKNQRRIIQMKAAREKAREKKEAAALKAGKDSQQPALDSEPSATGETSKNPEAKEDGETSASALKRKHEELEVEAEISGASADGDLSKKPKTEGGDDIEEDFDQGTEDKEDKPTARIWTEPTTNIQNIIITKPSYEMRGHTSYLTFALYYPASIRQQLDAQDVAPTPGGSTPVPKRLEEVAGESREDRSGSQETEYGDKAMEEVMGTMTEEDMMALGA